MFESADEFRRLRTSDDPAEYLRAAHDEAPVEVWRDVLGRFVDLRFSVAQNKTVPVEILDELSRDSDPRVRTMVAMKHKLPLMLQEQLATDPDEGVRQQLALNRKVSRDVLLRLANDAEPLVAEAARRRVQEAEG